MATTQVVKTVSLPRGATFRGDIGKVVKLNTSGQVVLTEAVTDFPVGVLAEADAPAVEGVGQSVAPVGSAIAVALLSPSGILKMKAGAAVTAGQHVLLHATGGTVQGVTTLGTTHDKNHVLGVAVEAAAVNDIFEVLVQPFHYTN